MTKYKTNAQKLKFFNDAKAARMPKAMFGRAVTPPQPTDPAWKKYEPRGPEDRINPLTGGIDTMYTNTTAGEMAKLAPVDGYTNTTKGEIMTSGNSGPRMSYNKKRGGAIKGKKRK
jgi:hypothetical protein